MKKLLTLTATAIISLGILSPALATTKEEQLNQIIDLLSRKLAGRETPAKQKPNTTSELAKSIATIHKVGATVYGTIDTYSPHLVIRRDEAATILYRFTKNIGLLNNYNSNKNCYFSDIDIARPSIRKWVYKSCKYGIFVGYKGKFSPHLSITNGEAMAVIGRALDGYKPGTDMRQHRAINYYHYMKKHNYLRGLPANDTSKLDEPITRGDIAILLARVYNNKNR